MSVIVSLEREDRQGNEKDVELIKCKEKNWTESNLINQ